MTASSDLRELRHLGVLKKLALVAAVLVALFAAFVWLFHTYGWYRYSKVYMQTTERLKKAIGQGPRNTVLPLQPLEPLQTDGCGGLELDDKPLTVLVQMRDAWLAEPTMKAQMCGLAAGASVMDQVIDALDASAAEPEQLLGYLQLGEGVGWHPMFFAWIHRACPDLRPQIANVYDWLLDGYVGALCVGVVRGIYSAVEQPLHHGDTDKLMREGCESAFVGARRYCGRLLSEDLAANIDLRRLYLQALQRTRQMVEAAKQAEPRQARTSAVT